MIDEIRKLEHYKHDYGYRQKQIQIACSKRAI